ncbi:MAG: hypothetical protein Q4G50_02920 [Corynebacterium sp.]|nr:hypothetical protein [Corynebacterium sp.]
MMPALLCLGLAGCGVEGDVDKQEAPEQPAIDLQAELIDIARAAAATGGRVGIALATGDEVIHVGLSGESWAWSTIKVPLAIEAERRDVAGELIDPTITLSDNNTSYQLARNIDFDLSELPHVPELDPLPGETLWPLREQAQFAAEIPCLDTGGSTYAAMAEIVDWQSYGLAEIDGARFKGGWGIDAPHQYSIRQLATVPVDGGYIGIAVQTYPDDASHDQGMAVLDVIGQKLDQLIDAHDLTPAAICNAY